MKYDRQNILSFWTVFCHFTSPLLPNNPKNQNLEKLKKMPGDIIILHMRTLNYNHMQGVSQKFPIWAVRYKLGISELWSRGVWGPTLKAPNGIWGKAPKIFLLFDT